MAYKRRKRRSWKSRFRARFVSYRRKYKKWKYRRSYKRMRRDTVMLANGLRMPSAYALKRKRRRKRIKQGFQIFGMSLPIVGLIIAGIYFMFFHKPKAAH